MTQHTDQDLEPVPNPPQADDPLAELRLRAEMLERQLADLQVETQARLIRAEMKTEAIRAGILDLDGLKLLDLAGLKLDENGDVTEAPALIARLKRTKPWLFGSASSSVAASAPPAQPPHPKHATEMTDAEYRIARAAVLKRRA